jgi:NTE family protein
MPEPRLLKMRIRRKFASQLKEQNMFRVLTCLLLTIILVTPATAVESGSRPKIGLVLSGGGARGAAHAGVLKVLEELRIPIDYIAGTSMGSIVGGLYATGMTAEQIADALISVDWDAALQDSIGREYRSMHRKRDADRYSIPFSPGFRDGEIQLPNAAIQGQNGILALQRFTDHVTHIRRFDELAIPFRAVATDIATGQKVILDRGDLATAMRASMAVPGVFAPIRYGVHLLIDGGISDNIPVTVAREMGADILIVIDISTPLLNEDEIDDLLTITDQLTRFMTQNNSQPQLATLTDRDILLVPELGDITSSAFDRTADAIAIGEATARENLATLSSFSVSRVEYDRYLAERPVFPAQKRAILSVNVEHNTNYADEVLNQKVDLKPGRQLDLDQMEENLTSIYGIGHFQSVGYELIQKSSGTDVHIRAIRKAIGPDYLHFGFQVDGYFDGDSSMNAVVGYTRTELNSTGGEWSTVLAVGSSPGLETYLFQPIGKQLNYFFLPRARLGREAFSLYRDDTWIAEYEVTSAKSALEFGYEFDNHSAVLFGVEYTVSSSDIRIGDPLLPEPDFDIGAFTLRYRYDTLDDIDFPASGRLMTLEYTDATDNLGSDIVFRQWQTAIGTVRTWRDYSLVLAARAGGTDGSETELTRLFRLGGFGRLTSLRPDQLTGKQMGLLQTSFYRRYTGIKFLPAFIGGMLEYGGAWEDWDDASKHTSLFSGTAFVAVDSPIGPAQLGLSFSDQGHSTVFFRVGRMFE